MFVSLFIYVNLVFSDGYKPSNQVFRELLKMFNTSAPPDLRKPVIGAIREMDVDLTQHINKQNELIERLIACLEEPIENSDDLSEAGRYLIVVFVRLTSPTIFYCCILVFRMCFLYHADHKQTQI